MSHDPIITQAEKDSVLDKMDTLKEGVGEPVAEALKSVSEAQKKCSSATAALHALWPDETFWPARLGADVRNAVDAELDTIHRQLAQSGKKLHALLNVAGHHIGLQAERDRIETEVQTT